jgi:hypothetical protein
MQRSKQEIESQEKQAQIERQGLDSFAFFTGGKE